MGQFRKNPVEIEAVQFTGDNVEEIQEFCGTFQWEDAPGVNVFHLYQGGAEVNGNVAEVWDKLHDTWVGVKRGQWIIRGLKGEYYPCDDNVFQDSYSEVQNFPAPTFRQELVQLINRHSLENASGTPDFIIASFLENVLTDWNHAIVARCNWRGEGIELPSLERLTNREESSG
jgi:hypothetical protein